MSKKCLIFQQAELLESTFMFVGFDMFALFMVKQYRKMMQYELYSVAFQVGHAP